MSSLYFSRFFVVVAIILLGVKDMVLLLFKFESPFNQGCLVPSFVEIGPVVSKEEHFMTTTPTMKENVQIGIRKASLSLKVSSKE